MMKLKQMLTFLLALALCLPLCACGGKRTEKYDKWPTEGISAVLPVPDTNKTKVYNYSDSFSAIIYSSDAIEEQFSTYVAKCESNGFTVDAKKMINGYEAYNQDGYRLSLNLFSSSERFTIDLYAPRVNGTFTWPSIGLATELPEPSTNIGTIQQDTSKQFSVWVGKTTIDDDKAYVESCKKLGFSIDYKNAEKKYSAQNADGMLRTLEHQGFNTMYISIKAPDSEGNEEASTHTENRQEAMPTRGSEDRSEDVSFDWSQGVLAGEVPLPNAEKTTLAYDGNDEFKVNIYGDMADFKEYVARCKEYGYDNEAENERVTEYTAWRGDGTKITIYFSEDKGYYTLYVTESVVRDPLTWPTTGVAALVPTPKGEKGKIEAYGSWYFYAYVGNMTENDFLDYVEQCKQYGYTLNETSWNGFFSADYRDDNGNSVSVTYEGFNTIRIEVYSIQK